MLAGEYAVLDGGAALVTAVDRYALAYWLAPVHGGSEAESRNSPDTAALPPEALVTRILAERAYRVVPASLHIQVDALRTHVVRRRERSRRDASLGVDAVSSEVALRSGAEDQRGESRKLGLGSSAAAAAATAGAVLAWAGVDVCTEAARREIFELAMQGHREIAPQGSGADVAASTFGSTLRFRRAQDDRQVAAELQALSWPAGLCSQVVWTGVEARTSDFVGKVRGWAASEPQHFSRVMGELRTVAEEMVTAFGDCDVSAVLETTRQHAAALAALGEAAGVPIVEERLAQIIKFAEQVGGAAKPSGAGGGDVAVAFFSDAEAQAAFVARCEESGVLEPLDLQLHAPGVGLDPVSSSDGMNAKSFPVSG